MSIVAAYRDVRERIGRAAEEAGRDPASVTLVAVSKTFPADAVRALYDLGHRDFGESRLQEALPKIEALPDDVRWHFLGNLQTNKARRVAETFWAVHSLTNERQLAEIRKAGRTVEGLIEVNIADEVQKSGISKDSLDAYVDLVLQCKCIRFRGLMTIGPETAVGDGIRPYFRALRELNRRVGGEWLSMGMSGDYGVAIQEGATHVRIGTAIFGHR
jgi:PLP dependent protein